MVKQAERKKALAKLKRTETATGRKVDRTKRAKSVVRTAKNYVPQQNDFQGVDTPRKRATKSGTAKKATRKSNPWLAHVKKTMNANKGCSFSEVLKKASATWKKKKC